MSCDIPIKFPVETTILDTDFPPFDKGRKLNIRQLADGKIRVDMPGSGIRFRDGDVRGSIGRLPAKLVIVFTLEGQDHHMVITRIRCGDRIRDCGVVVRLQGDRGVGTWVSEEDI